MKFILDNLVLVSAAVLSGMGLLVLTLQNSGPKAAPAQATLMINRGKHVLIDVRNADEFAASHVRDAKNIPLAELEKRLNELNKFKEHPVIVICNRGNLARRATAVLQRAGFTKAVTLEGGQAAWEEAGLPLQKAVKLAK